MPWETRKPDFVSSPRTLAKVPPEREKNRHSTAEKSTSLTSIVTATTAPSFDTHCHVVPDSWRKWCEKYGWDKPNGMPAIPAWSPESHIGLMDKVNISKSILSITSPGTYLKADDDKLANQITQEADDEIANICRRYPDRFGFFASLPLPDVEGSLNEIDRALDTLGASGFAIMTNAHGYYPGDPRLEPVFAKLNTRKAVIFMHPTECCTPGHADVPKALDQYPTPMMEYFFDTTRAVVSLLLSGIVAKYQSLTFLVSHCGATIPPLVERFTAFGAILGQKDSLSSTQVKELFRTRFYFDLTGFPFPDLIQGYVTVGDPSRLIYGSDYPYTPEKITVSLSERMDEGLRGFLRTR